MKRFYQSFLNVDDLAFDIGAHTGDRVRAFRDCGARVVALEPQPRFFALLDYLYGQDAAVALHPWGADKADGAATLFIATATPAVTTFSSEWIEVIQGERRFRGAQWDESTHVPVTTLDHLILLHGKPRFCRIGGEGLEERILTGLSETLAALSFTYNPVLVRKAVACVERLEELGCYCYNLVARETLAFQDEDWVDAAGIITRLLHLPSSAAPGEVYARLLHGYA